jgi:hypothetical protein
MAGNLLKKAGRFYVPASNKVWYGIYL